MAESTLGAGSKAQGQELGQRCRPRPRGKGRGPTCRTGTCRRKGWGWTRFLWRNDAPPSSPVISQGQTPNRAMCHPVGKPPPQSGPFGLSGVSCPPRPRGRALQAPRELFLASASPPRACVHVQGIAASPRLCFSFQLSAQPRTPIPQAWKEAGSHRPRDESILCCLSGKCCREHGVHRSGLSSGRWSWVPGSRLGPGAPLRGRSVMGLSPQHASFSCCCVLFSMF